MSKPTPGPWKAYENENADEPHSTVGVTAGRGTSAQDVAACAIGGLSPEAMRANARLIAASPRLLAALQALDAVIQLDPDPDNLRVLAKQLGLDDVRALSAACQEAMAAITDATGEPA